MDAIAAQAGIGAAMDRHACQTLTADVAVLKVQATSTDTDGEESLTELA